MKNRIIRIGGAFWMALLASSAFAGTPLPIATGGDPNVERYLLISVDEYGSWTSQFGGYGADMFHPTGLATMSSTFTSGFMLFVPDRTQRELLSDSPSWQGVVSGASDTSLARSILVPNASSDTTTNGVDDTLTSSFHVTGTDTDLRFDLTQSVEDAPPGGSLLRQVYTITNQSALPITFTLLRLFDADMMWSGGFSDDEVGTETNALPGSRSVFMQDMGLPSTRVTLHSDEGRDYVGTKQGITPPGGPVFDFGTDTDQWINFGIPLNWRNVVANVGAGVDGNSGPNPGGDASINLDVEITLQPTATTTIELQTGFGPDTVSPRPYTPVPVPTLLGWGIFSIALLVLMTGVAVIRRREI